MKRNEIYLVEAKLRIARKLAMNIADVECTIADLTKAIDAKGSLLAFTVTSSNVMSNISVSGINATTELTGEFLRKCKANLKLKLMDLEKKLEEL